MTDSVVIIMQQMSFLWNIFTFLYGKKRNRLHPENVHKSPGIFISKWKDLVNA